MSEESMQQPTERSEESIRSLEGTLTVESVRSVAMTEAAYVFLMRVLHEHAPHVIRYAFYDMGFRVGEQLMAAYPVGVAGPERAFRQLVDNYKLMGYGDLEVVHFDLREPEARLTGTNLFETAVAIRSGVYRTPRCVDHYSRGMFAGFLSKLLDREVVCEEVACQFRGDERCEFVVLPFERSGSAAQERR
ncbi:MAG: V4R domain-containing protein [Sphingomonadaceae bacterium]